MSEVRRLVALFAVIACVWFPVAGLRATEPTAARSQEVIHTWYKLILELVRHTPTYSPPVASRSFAYLGVTAFEAVAAGSAQLQTLAGQLNGLKPVHQHVAGQAYDQAVVLNAAMTLAANSFFSNTGPTGQRALTSLGARMHAAVAAGLPADVVERSEAYGRMVAADILAWSEKDGGRVVENMGFPLEYTLTAGAGQWVPTSLIRQQQKPLLPNRGKNRPFAMPEGSTCALPEPPVYSEDKTSAFYKEALEVYETSKTLTDDQRAIARFWSDDPMLSSTPPGHWIEISLRLLTEKNAAIEENVDVLARLGVATADAFIGCWNAKYQYNVLRPVTYIRRLLDPRWESLMVTPPFPEYPSGHSTQSGAAAVVLTKLFGDNRAFEDHTHEEDGLNPRSYASFWAAANEAGLSRLYGGIHFRAAIELGLDQGRCIGAFASALRTRR